jgi:sugar O-acyltransferase (sialic acid O-acetyltransferase NeuD family)
MKKVIIFGTGAFAEVAYFYLTEDSNYDVVGFTINKKFITEENFCGLPVIEFENIESKYSPTEFSMFIAIGYKNMNKIRANIFNESKQKGYQLISYINSKATVWKNLSIGENCFILENNVIQPFVKIGNDVILWSGNHIGHHSTISDHCFISSHVVISGFTKINSYSFLGVNSTIRDGVTIASECLIGAGTLILKNTKKGGVYTSKDATLLSISSDKLTQI